MKIVTLLVFFILISGEAFSQNRMRRSGRLIVKMKSDSFLKRKSMSFADLSRRHRFKKHRQRNRSGLVEIVKEDVNTMSEEQMAKELMASGAVEFAEPDYLFQEASTPNDPKFSQQWMHTKIRTPAAWDYTTGSEDIIVAVCDSGVDATHPDLQGRVLPGFNTWDSSLGSNPRTNHGTNVAGLIAAAGDDGFGMAGMAWRSKILPIRICNSSGSYSSSAGCGAYLSDMAECIELAADKGAKVINLSFSGFSSATIDSAAKYARSKGALLVMAAGNDGSNVSGSRDDASFILVGNSTSADKKSGSSNYGTPIDLFAPGDQVLVTGVGGGHYLNSGTSFSAPVVSGLAALIWSINPDFTPEQVENILFSTADNIGVASTFGNGRINAEKAILAALEGSDHDRDPVAQIQVAAGRAVAGTSVSFDSVGSQDDHGIVRYQWQMGDGTVHEGARINHVFERAGDYTVKLTVWDVSNQSASAELKVKVYATALPLASVENIKMTVFYTKSYSRTESQITVADEEGRLISGATVKTIFDNGTVVSAVTNSSGVALIKGPTINVKKHLHVIKIQDITHPSYQYDSSLNDVSTKSIQVR